MADSKITALTAISTVDPTADPLVIVDVSDTSMAASGTTKKSTINQLLGAGGTATLASATISGDLTVATSALKVTGGQVGIGAAAPSAKLTVLDTNGIPIRFGDIAAAPASQTACYVGVSTSAFSGNGNGDLILVPRTSDVRDVVIYTGSGTAAERFRVSGTGVATWSNVGGVAGTAMTLNSTGLGIGVAPSAWDTNYKALQLGYPNFISGNNGGNIIDIGVNAYFNTDWKYAASSVAATRYRQVVGVHQWFTAPSGTAGNAITFTQAMTLTAGGDLLLGKTARDLINAGVEILPSGQTTNIVASSVGGFTTLEVYSTTAAAYRFYVGMNGTISATNTTISGISDARLKENVQDIDVGLGAILALKPRKFDWKAGKGKDIKGDRGFIAQEFETVFPNLIDEWKENAPEGEAPYKSVRQDLIPVLVKAIQELAAEVNALKNA